MRLKLCLLFVFLNVTAIHSATMTWTNVAGGSWQTAANWQPNQVPGANDTALITTAGDYTVTLAGNVTVSQVTIGAASGLQTLSINTQTLTTTNGTVAAHGAILMQDGTLEGKVTVANGGLLTFSGGAQKLLYNLTLNNNGTVKWNGGILYIGSTPTTVITNAGLWEINSDSSINLGIGGPTPQFVNTATGVVRKIGGAATTTISNMRFNNSGLVDVQSGILQLTSSQGSMLGGNFTASAGAAFQLAGGTYTENGGAFTGAGAARMTAGTLSLVSNILTGFSLNGGDVQVVSSAFQNAGAITNLTLNGATLIGTNEISGNVTVLDGGMEGLVTIRSGGVLTFSTTAQKILYKLTLNNNGTVKWNGGILYIGSTPTTIINNSGLWEINSDTSINLGVGGPTPQFVNTSSGVIRKIGGAGTTTISNLRLVNSGLVDVQSGILQLTSSQGSMLGGTFTASAGAAFQLAGGTYTENGGSFTGAGSGRMTAGTLSLVTNILAGFSLNAGDVQVVSSTFQNAGAITNLTINGATLIGTNEISGTVTVLDGGIEGQLTVRTGGVLTFSTTAQKILYKLTLNNNGTVKWNGGILYIGSTPTTIINNAGLWEINSDTSVNLGVGGPTPQFVNTATGVIRKIGGAGTTTISNLRFINGGLVDVQNGILQLTSSQGSILGGTFTASAGAAFQLAGGAYTENGGSFTGAGSGRMTAGTLSLVNNILSGFSLNAGDVQVVSSTFQNAGAITNLTLNGATLIGTNEVSGTLTVLDGGIEGNLTVRNGGTLALSTTAQKILYKLTLNNNGTVKWNGGILYIGSTPTTIINNSGLWEINSDTSINLGVGGPTPQFVNTSTGTIRKIGGAGTTTISNMRLTNSGLVDAQSGILQLTSSQGSMIGGTFTASAGAAFQLAGGTYTENGGSFTGLGAGRMTAGTLSLVTNILTGFSLEGGAVQVISSTFQNAGAITNLTLNGATLIGTNEVSGTMTVLDGGIEDQLTVRSGGLLTFSTTAQKILYKLTLNNNGTVKWNGGILYIGSTPTTIINNTGLWEINSDTSINLGVGGATPQFVNTASGVVRKIGGAGTSTISNLRFINSGLVDVQNGILQLTSSLGSILGGAFTAAAGAAFQLAGGTYTENGGSFTGAGAARMTAGTLSLVTNILAGFSLNGGDVQVVSTNFQNSGAITNLTINGATLTGTNEVSGALTVLDGGIEGQLTVRNSGVLTFSTAAQKILYQLTLNNNGTVKWNGGILYVGSTPTTIFNNSGLWEINSDTSINLGVGGPTVQFNNTSTGVIRKIGGSGTSTFATGTVSNNGVIEAQSGTVRLPNNYINSNGTLRLTGGRIEAAGLLTMASGTLEGSGSIGNSLFNGGTISPGLNGPGRITFTAGLTLTTGVTVVIDALNATPGTGHDQLTVAGPVELGGANLQISSIAPLLVGARLNIIDNDGTDLPISTFANLPEGWLFTSNFQLLRIRYTTGTGNDVALVRDDGGVRFTAVQRLTDGSFKLTGLGTNFGDYTISATTDFNSWVDVGTVKATSGGVFQITDTNAPSFRYRFYRSLGPGLIVP